MEGIWCQHYHVTCQCSEVHALHLCQSNKHGLILINATYTFKESHQIVHPYESWLQRFLQTTLKIHGKPHKNTINSLWGFSHVHCFVLFWESPSLKLQINQQCLQSVPILFLTPCLSNSPPRSSNMTPFSTRSTCPDSNLLEGTMQKSSFLFNIT